MCLPVKWVWQGEKVALNYDEIVPLCVEHFMKNTIFWFSMKSTNYSCRRSNAATMAILIRPASDMADGEHYLRE